MLNDCMLGPAESCEHPTPQPVFDALDAEFGFQLDVCATAENAKCARFFTVKENGLAQPWTGICWMNPPYGDEIPRWIKKAYDSACEGYATVVCLLPARVDTRWFHGYCLAGEVRFIPGRIKFVGSEDPAPFPSMVVVFHAHLDPGGIVKAWDWRQKNLGQESLQFNAEVTP